MRPTVASLLAACGAALLALTLLGLQVPHPAMGAFGIGYGADLRVFAVIFGMQGIVYALAVIAILRTRRQLGLLAPILIIGVLLRLPALIAPPFLSNDMYRYIWDGWVQCAGINPYRYLPADPHLAFLRDAVVYPNINRATYAHTIYPPAAEMVFAAVAGTAGLIHLPPVLAMKLAMTGFEALGVVATMRLLTFAGLPRSRILIYLWNPLPVWEFAGNGHVDAIAIGFVALALLAAAAGRPGRAAAALGAAVLTKFLPLILAAAFWCRWDRRFIGRFAGIFAGVILLLYAPYLGAGKHVLGFLGGYAAQEGLESGHGIFLVSLLGGVLPLPRAAAKVYLASLALAVLVTGLVMTGRKLPSGPPRARAIAGRALILISLLMAGISPHYPWYYAWVLVPACILPAASSLYLATASFALYLNPTHAKLLWPAAVFIPCALLAIADLRKRGSILLPAHQEDSKS